MGLKIRFHPDVDRPDGLLDLTLADGERLLDHHTGLQDGLALDSSFPGDLLQMRDRFIDPLCPALERPDEPQKIFLEFLIIHTIKGKSGALLILLVDQRKSC